MWGETPGGGPKGTPWQDVEGPLAHASCLSMWPCLRPFGRENFSDSLEDPQFAPTPPLQFGGKAPWGLWGIPWPGRGGPPDSGFLPIQVALA